MHNAVTIERFDLSEKDELLVFLKKAFAENPRQSDPEFWDWHFVESPHSRAEKMPVWLAKSGGQIAGHLAAIPVELKVGGELLPAIWILDLIVDPQFRRQGIGKKLALAAEEFCPLMLGANTMEQHSPALLEGLGWKIVSRIPRFHKLLFPGAAVREISKIKPLAKAVNLGFAPFRPRSKTENLQEKENLRLLDGFDADFDKLWNEASGQWNCAVKRDAKMLVWQYQNQPGKKYDILGCYEKGNLRGYAVLFFRKPDANGAISKAAISDIFYHPENAQKTVDALLKGALQIAVERRAGGLVTDVIDPLIEKRLEFFKFWRVKNPLLLMVKTDVRQDLLYDEKSWFWTRGDADISIFEEPNL